MIDGQKKWLIVFIDDIQANSPVNGVLDSPYTNTNKDKNSNKIIYAANYCN